MTSHFVLTLAGYGCAALVAAEFYLLPVVIGWARRVPRLRMVAVIDLALGWTVIGWIVAVALALRPVPRTAPETARDGAARQAAGRAGPAAEESARQGHGLRQPDAAPPLVLPASSADSHPPQVSDASCGC